MRRSIIIGLLTCFVATAAYGQSTISNEPFELTYSSGPWGVLLPSYRFGVDIGGATAFQDDGDTLGAKWQVKAVRRFLGTRTSFETKAFFGWAEVNSLGTSQDMNLPNPNDGTLSFLAGADTHLESSVAHYGSDVALRDTWQTRFGGLSAGVAFSYMGFDQDFELQRNDARFIDEDLNSDFLGGKGFVGWDGCLLGRRTNLDLAFGYYDVDAEYKYVAPTLAQTFSTETSDESLTIELDFTTRFCLRGFDAGLNLGVMYIEDMPMINHQNTIGNPATIESDQAFLINAQVEIRL